LQIGVNGRGKTDPCQKKGHSRKSLGVKDSKPGQKGRRLMEEGGPLGGDWGGRWGERAGADNSQIRVAQKDY